MKQLLAFVTIIMLEAHAGAKSIWQDKNPYTSEGDIKVGSVILIAVNDLTDMRFNFSVTDRSNSSVSSDPDVTITGFLPKVSAGKRFGSDDSTQFTGRGKISFSIATRVTNRVAGGALLAVTGSRTYTFSGATNIITVTGLVDPALVKGRTIDSNSVVDFTLEIRGAKQGINLQRPPLKPGETANANLTEEEKQRIILDYLRKMLGELMR
jgi:flagellar L-ring protein precursor FlgH